MCSTDIQGTVRVPSTACAYRWVGHGGAEFARCAPRHHANDSMLPICVKRERACRNGIAAKCIPMPAPPLYTWQLSSARASLQALKRRRSWRGARGRRRCAAYPVCQPAQRRLRLSSWWTMCSSASAERGRRLTAPHRRAGPCIDATVRQLAALSCRDLHRHESQGGAWAWCMIASASELQQHAGA